MYLKDNNNNNNKKAPRVTRRSCIKVKNGRIHLATHVNKRKAIKQSCPLVPESKTV